MSEKVRIEIDGEHTTFRDDLLDKFIGEWKVSGNVLGEPLEQHARVQWILGHQFVEMHMAGKATQGSSDPPYEARVFIGRDNLSERYVVHWLDTFGGRFSEVLGYGTKLDDSSMRFVFDGFGGPLRNTISYDSSRSTWQMHIVQKNNKGEWYTFAEETFEKLNVKSQ